MTSFKQEFNSREFFSLRHNFTASNNNIRSPRNSQINVQKSSTYLAKKKHCFYMNKTKRSVVYREIIYDYAENYNKGGVHEVWGKCTVF